MATIISYFVFSIIQLAKFPLYAFYSPQITLSLFKKDLRRYNSWNNFYSLFSIFGFYLVYSLIILNFDWILILNYFNDISFLFIIFIFLILNIVSFCFYYLNEMHLGIFEDFILP